MDVHKRVTLSKEALVILERNRKPDENTSTTLTRLLREREISSRATLKGIAKKIIKEREDSVNNTKTYEDDTGGLEW